MPADLNQVALIGRLTRDPELRHSAGGAPIASLRLAVTSRGKDQQGNWEDRSNYFDVTVFGRQAESVTTYLEKGSKLGLSGRLSWREWTTQDGGKRQAVEVVANEVYFLSFKEGANGGGGGQGGGYAPASDLPASTAPAGAPAGGGDDIPF